MDFQDRVRAEKRDLDEKIDRLRSFIAGEENSVYQSLPTAEQVRLRLQIKAMIDYSEMLGLRIEAFAVPKRAASHPDVPRPSNDELVSLSYDLCLAIEQCGASPELTHASMLASDLHTYLRKPG